MRGSKSSRTRLVRAFAAAGRVQPRSRVQGPHGITSKHSLKLFLSLVLLSGCSFLTEPLGYDLPDPDLSLDPTALVQPRLLYGCGEWLNGPRPDDEKILVDVSFVRPTLKDPEDRPTATHLAALKRHGGQVLYTFQFPAVRAWIATDDIPGLDAEIAVESLFRVANPRRYDWNASVGYIGQYSYKDGATRFAELGGRVDYRFDVINAISGLIPDRSSAVIRGGRNVDYMVSAVPYPNCF